MKDQPQLCSTFFGVIVSGLSYDYMDLFSPFAVSTVHR